MRHSAGTFPVFGWTYLSRQALRDAEAQLHSHGEGMRDEIGFLFLHSRFADHFFPGTSVLQTRLRYVLFVSWMYRAFLDRRQELRGRLAAEFETQLAGRLRDWARRHGQTGVIGERNTRRIMISRPSAVYWHALKTWAVMRPEGRGRLSLERALENLARKVDLELEDEDEWLGLVDADLPPAPANFWGNDDIGFALQAPERDYLRRKLGRLMCDGRTSLLAKLVNADPAVLETKECFLAPVRALAGEDARWLELADGTSALCGVGRGVYAALVEEMREQDGRKDRTYRDTLVSARDKLAPHALELDVDALDSELHLGVGSHLRNVLLETQAWLRSGRESAHELMPVYRAAEWHKKRGKACLQPGARGFKRREEWRLDPALGGTDPAVPLHYRWPKVQQLLKDLAK